MSMLRFCCAAGVAASRRAGALSRRYSSGSSVGVKEDEYDYIGASPRFLPCPAASPSHPLTEQMYMCVFVRVCVCVCSDRRRQWRHGILQEGCQVWRTRGCCGARATGRNVRKRWVRS